MNMRFILIVAIIVFIISSCSNKSNNSSESKVDVITYAIFKTSWLLQSFSLGTGNTLTVPSGKQYTLVFYDSTTAIGTNDCNTFNIAYAATSTGIISMQGYSSTKIYCGATSYDDTFKVALQNSSNFEVINGSQLKIYYSNKEKILYFIKQ
jgi:heat shock protein HslJ